MPVALAVANNYQPTTINYFTLFSSSAPSSSVDLQ